MSRGAEQQQQILANNASSAQQQQANALENGSLIPGYTNLVTNPGYTPAQQAAITNASMGAAGAAYNNAAAQAMNTATRTNNDASLNATQDALAQQKGQTMANQAAQNQVQFANDAQQEQEEGLQGLSGLYKENASLGPSYMGIGQQAASTPGFLDSIMGNVIGALGQMGSAYLGGQNQNSQKCWVAEELYGPFSFETAVLRRWFNFAEKPLVWAIVSAIYGAIGKHAATLARNSSIARRLLKVIFDRALIHARKYLTPAAPVQSVRPPRAVTMPPISLNAPQAEKPKVLAALAANVGYRATAPVA